ncbi:hypothetical protein CQZ88_20620, partial [Rhodococcus sp. ENV425]
MGDVLQLDAQARDLELRLLEVRQRERDLEQRVVRGGPGRAHRLDHLIEGDVGVGERGQVGLAHLRHQVGEGDVRPHR